MWMNSICCDICLETFSEVNHIPKVLNCGHTFCHLCLGKLLLQSEKYCPSCRATLTKPLEEYPTNFFVLRQIKVIEENSTCSSDHVICTLKKIEKELVQKRDMLVKSIKERTTLKNLIINDITKVKQMLEMDADIRNANDAKKLILELENDVEKVDTILYCCGKSDPKSTYTFNNYKDTSFYLYDIANRLHKGEDIYAYKTIQFSKPKYGKLTLNNDRIDIHALDLSTIAKNASIVSFEDLRKCITSQNFRTFVCVDEQTISFSITDSSYLASRFVKLCSGETGPMLKGISGTTPQIVGQSYHYNEYGQYVNQYVQTEHVLIKKYMLKEYDFDDYDLNIFTTESETSYSVGDVVVQMFPNGPCQIHKCDSSNLTFKNVVAKASSCTVTLFGDVPILIMDSGISIIFKL